LAFLSFVFGHCCLVVDYRKRSFIFPGIVPFLSPLSSSSPPLSIQFPSVQPSLSFTTPEEAPSLCSYPTPGSPSMCSAFLPQFSFKHLSFFRLPHVPFLLQPYPPSHSVHCNPIKESVPAPVLSSLTFRPAPRISFSPVL